MPMLTRDAIYVQVFAKRFVVRNADSSSEAEVTRNQQFASPRMLIADFTMADHQLKEAIKKVRRGFLAPLILIHPKELIAGGITQVESDVHGTRNRRR